MSKLPKAPLLEVIFEINWDITNKNDIVKFQYLHGDLYSKLKDKYPHRENLIPPEVPFDIVKRMPVYRFREKPTSYPLIQVGPGILTYNTIDELYFWADYQRDINNLIASFSSVYVDINKIKLSPTLTYIDFFEVDLEKNNLIDFINENLKLNVTQSVIDNNMAKDINMTISYQLENSTLSLNLRNGSINNNKKGILLQTKLIGNKKVYSISEQMSWLNEAHETCSSLFKKITDGQLYNSFK